MSVLDTVRPRTVEELAEAVRAHPAVHAGAWSGGTGVRVDLGGLAGVAELHSEDQVVVARAGSTLEELNSELAAVGQTIPIPAHLPLPLRGFGGELARMVGFALPHALEAQCGSWRDWVLGMTVVLADGTIAKTGSKAVKNVAGYDVHKLLIGSRGTLAVVAEVVLRTYPLASLPEPDLEVVAGGSEAISAIQRVLPSDFHALRETAAGCAFAFDRATSTAWLVGGAPTVVPRFPSDWRIAFDASGPGWDADETTRALMRRTKSIFDPTGKLNAGALQS